MEKFSPKILTLGETTVGKTSLLNKFTENTFSKTQFATIGIDFKLKKININGKTIELKIWDTAGQERYRNLTKQYYKGADGILLIFDLTKKETFLKINDWIDQLNSHFNQDEISIILIGNKKDLSDREISYEEGNERGKELNILYFETSAKTGENVNEAFNCLTNEIFKKKGIFLDRNNSLQINQKKFLQKTSKKSCC